MRKRFVGGLLLIASVGLIAWQALFHAI